MDKGYQDAEYLDQTFQGLQISGSEVRDCAFLTVSSPNAIYRISILKTAAFTTASFEAAT
jgi:hypothetical protein